MNGTTLAAQLTHEPFPHLAAALRVRTDRILKQWRKLSIAALPNLTDEQTRLEFEDDIAKILDTVADSLERDDAWRIDEVLHHGPKHGVDRFVQKYPLADLMTENRLLRGVILVEIEAELGRPPVASEAASLHAMIDIIFSSGAEAMVTSMHTKLCETAESELKFLAFISHDLRKSLVAALAHMERAEEKLTHQPGLQDTAELLRSTRETIGQTSVGMKRLVTGEQLRRSNAAPRSRPMRVLDAVTRIIHPLGALAETKKAPIEVEIDPALEIETNADLLALVLQNIISNAITHGADSTVHITGELAAGDRCRISVADKGPGIALNRLRLIVEAFERGEALGAQGVGLGLAIASQAAKLLGAEIDVKTELGAGTVFSVLLPVRPENAPAS